MISMYDALESRTHGLAQLSDESPAVQHLIRSFAMTAAKWGRLTRNDVTTARVQTSSKGDFIAFHLVPGTGLVAARTTIIKTDFANAAEFLRCNIDALDAVTALIRWGLPHIAKGATSFTPRWQPHTGYVSFKANYPKPAVAI